MLCVNNLVGFGTRVNGGNDINTQMLIQPRGADESTSFSDVSQNGFTVTPAGDAQVDTGVTLLGVPTVKFDGTGDSLQIADNAALRAGTGDFTIDFLLRLAGGGSSQSVWAKGYVGSGDLLIQIDTSEQINIFFSGSLLITSSALSTSTDYHIALERNGSTLTLYVDGTDDGNTTDSTDLNGTQTLYIGDASTPSPVNGNMGEIRYSNVARYKGDFTPPTVPYF